ncbi:MAG: zinc-dependent metalloprotease [Candidatus Eisenbacteria bacterium]|nr:zinc-dependent metalloprotease [Candidatus Eisenbacteria bacterium]
MKRKSFTTFPIMLGALALAVLVGAGPAGAADKDKDRNKDRGGATPAAPEKPEKPFTDWKKLTKDAEAKPGFFTLWKKRDNLYLEISPDQLGKPFLYVVSIARGIGGNFVLGGLPLDDRMLRFERVGDRVLLYDVNTRFTAPKNLPIDRALDLSIPNSVLASFKIESEQDSTKHLLVDAAGWFVSDATDLAERLKGALGNVSVRFDKERSAVTGVKAFPRNCEVEALLTFSPNDRSRLSVEAVPDERYIPVSVHYSLCALPETPMAERWADNRVGYFLGAVKDFSRDDKESFWLRHVNRWRLEKKDPTAAVSEVVKPITFYVDWTVPEKFRPWVKEGVENWQKAFAAAGLQHAIVAVDAPKDDPDWDAEDTRYSTVRWITSNEPSFGAIGPSRVDPRTGEIFDADILFEASMFQSYANAYRRYVDPQAMAATLLPESRLAALPRGLGLGDLCTLGDALSEGGSLQHVAMLMDDAIPPGAPIPDAYLHRAVVWAVMHEVGHTLGLRHNFRSSTSTPDDRLQDKAWTEANGLYSSVMEYPSPNIDYTHRQQGDYWTTTPGTYDLWAIRYGYTPSNATDPDSDYAFARRIADESLQAGHEYSTDEDTYPADAPDPRSNIYDLGNDPLQFAKDRTTYIAGLWRNPKLEDRIVGGSGDLTALRRAMVTLLQQYGIASGMAVKYLGGSYLSRVERGQPGERDPIVPVPAALQRDALAFLSQRVWAAGALDAPPALLDRMAPSRWSHWGMGPGGVFAGRQDFNWNDYVLAVQSGLVSAATSPALLARMREAENRSADPYRLSEHFDRLTRALWGEVGGAAPAAMKALDGTGTRRDVQRAYVDRLAAMVTGELAVNDDALSLARLQLQRIDARCARVLALAAPLGDNTRAHLLEARARIKRALEAGTDVSGGAAAGARGQRAADGTR